MNIGGLTHKECRVGLIVAGKSKFFEKEKSKETWLLKG